MKEPLRVGWLGPHFSGKTVWASKRPEIGDGWELDGRAARNLAMRSGDGCMSGPDPGASRGGRGPECAGGKCCDRPRSDQTMAGSQVAVTVCPCPAGPFVVHTCME